MRIGGSSKIARDSRGWLLLKRLTPFWFRLRRLRQRQMADEEPAFGDSRCVDRKVADLPMHLTHRSLIDGHVISNM